MIFDSPEMVHLREKYRTTPDFDVPRIVLLDRCPGFSQERARIEELVSRADHVKANQWKRNLIQEIEGQHLGAWFEIRLYGWLSQHFPLRIEPDIPDGKPDFCVSVHGKEIYIEARSVLYSPVEAKKRNTLGWVNTWLESIRMPYAVMMIIKSVGRKPQRDEFISCISQWLEESPEREFIYKDSLGNHLVFTARNSSSENVLFASIETMIINPDRLKAPLREKAKSYSSIRNANLPYVIAIFLEPAMLSAEEIVEAWLGRTQTIVDTLSGEIIENRIDRSGIHFFGNEVRHKSVSGTLVFKRYHDEARAQYYLKCWHVQNPFAHIEIDPNLFPCEARFIVLSQKDGYYQMDWQNG